MARPAFEKNATTIDERVSEPYISNSEIGDEEDVSLWEELRVNLAYQRISSLFHWSDPIESFLVFGIMNFFFFLVTFGGYSVASLICYVMLCLLLACGVFVNGSLLSASSKKIGKMENPIKKRWTAPTVEVSPRDVEQCVELVVLVLNRSYTELREIYSCTYNIRSLKFAVYLVLFSIIGNVLSGIQILYFGLNLLFIWPKLYSNYSRKIDKFIDKFLGMRGALGELFLKLLPQKVRVWLSEENYSSAPHVLSNSPSPKLDEKAKAE